MPFQNSVAAQIGAGVPGELALDGPFRGQPGIIHTADATKNVVGRACTITDGATGSWAAGSAGADDPQAMIVEAGGAGVFAGILANPKVYGNLGTAAGGALAATMTLPNDVAVELVTEGVVWGSLPAASNPGDYVYFLTASGALVSAAPDDPAPGASAGPIGTVERFKNAGASLAMIRLPGPGAVGPQGPVGPEGPPAGP